MKDDMEKVYLAYALPVKKYILSLCHDHTLADDITAETFYKALKNIDSFQEGRMLTWLCAIARNTWLDYIHKKEYLNQSVTEETEARAADSLDSPEEAYLKKDEKMMLYRQIQKLDPRMKDVVYLRIFAELSFKEIGAVLGKSENWARVMFFRSKNQLKGWMEYED